MLITDQKNLNYHLIIFFILYVSVGTKKDLQDSVSTDTKPCRSSPKIGLLNN